MKDVTVTSTVIINTMNINFTRWLHVLNMCLITSDRFLWFIEIHSVQLISALRNITNKQFFCIANQHFIKETETCQVFLGIHLFIFKTNPIHEHSAFNIVNIISVS